MTSTQSAQTSTSVSAKTFDFTKRKRWADLLATDLAEGTNVVLSATCVVLYCGPTIQELIGWRDEDLVDRNLLEFLSSDDQGLFRACFDESLQGNTRLHAYVRFKCNDGFTNPHSPEPKQVLFEIKGRPQHLREADGKLLFITAKPYPSHNTDMLNIFLDLKIEHEQLQGQLYELRQRVPPETLNLIANATTQLYPPSSSSSQQLSGTFSVSRGGNDLTYPGAPSGVIENMLNKGPIGGSSNEGTTFAPPSAPGPSGPVNSDEDPEEGQKKKKQKKNHGNDQYVCVTCGRTDSPEWRKGPLGPKTLCNACGLRWAKQSRKTDDPSGQGNDGGGEK